MTNNDNPLKKMINDIDSLGELINFINRGFEIPIFLKLDEYDLEPHNFHILNHIHKNDKIIQKDLAEEFGKNQSTITRSLKKLEKKRFIERYHGKNKKNKQLVLTEKGKNTMKELEEYTETLEKDYLSNFSSEQKELMTELLEKLAFNIAENKF